VADVERNHVVQQLHVAIHLLDTRTGLVLDR
jgi:hypothetical protein